MFNIISVFFTLLCLYCLPLVLLIFAMLTTLLAPGNESFHSIVVSVFQVYITPVRDALASFVMPFVAAFAVSSFSDGQISKKTAFIFYSMVVIVGLSVLAAAWMAANGREYVAVHGSDGLVPEEVLALPGHYLKESLAYISLILGIGGANLVARTEKKVAMED